MKKKEGVNKVSRFSLDINCIVFALLVISIIYILFKPAEKYEFLNFDDNKLIYENPVVISGKDKSLKDIYQFQKNMAHYKPLTVLSWNREYEKHGDNPSPYHRHNNWIHILNVLLAFVIVRKLGLRFLSNPDLANISAFIISLFFGIHPMRIESVVWITERKDVLYSFFYLAALLSYIVYTEKKYRWYLLIPPVLLYFLGIHSKSPAITFLAIPFLVDFIYSRKYKTGAFIDKIPLFLVFIYAWYVYGFFENFSSQASGISEGIASSVQYKEHVDIIAGLNPLLRRFILVNFKFWFWIVHNLVPFKLSIIYPRDLLLEKTGVFLYLSPLFSAGLAYLLYRFRKKKLFVFSVMFYIITISPALAISDRGTGIFVSDRYSYLSSIGIFSTLVFPLTDVLKRKIYGLLALCAIYAFLMLDYLPKWRNSETLFSDVVEKYPLQIPVAYNNLGLYYKDNNNPEKAIKYYNLVLKISPGYENAKVNLANVYFNSGKFREAIPLFTQVLEKNKRSYQAYSNRGACYFSLGKRDSALLDFNRAISIRPSYIDARANRALVYMDLKMGDSAIIDLTKLEELVPRNAEYINARGVVYQKRGEHQKAIEDFNKAASISPQLGKIYSNRSLSYFYLKDFIKAKDDIDKAAKLGVKINPRYIEILNKQLE